MKACLLRLMLVLAVLPGLVQAKLSTDISTLIEKNLPFANVGVQIEDAASGKVLYQRNSFQVFTPASNTKLFTAAAALYGLGKDYRYATSVYYDPAKLKNQILKGNLTIKFSGDPSLRVENLRHLIDELAGKGIKQIKGDLVIDNTRFQMPAIMSGISYDDLAWYYAAPVNTIILNDNALQTVFIPSRKLGGVVRIKPDPDIPSIHIKSHLRTVTQSFADKFCDVTVSAKAYPRLTVSGCYPISAQAQVERLAIPDSLWLAKHIIAKRLRHHGIRLEGKIITGKVAAGLTVQISHHSQPLSKLLIHMLQYSDNVYANSFTKTLGANLLGRGSYKAGVLAEQQVLHKHSNLDFSQMDLADGAGSRYNLISPRQITELLFSVYHSPAIRHSYFTALAKPGRSGSLHARMLGFGLRDHVKAKTGSMHDVSALSGYVTTASGREIIFSLLINHVVGGIAPAKRLEEKILAAVVKDAP